MNIRNFLRPNVAINFVIMATALGAGCFLDSVFVPLLCVAGVAMFRALWFRDNNHGIIATFRHDWQSAGRQADRWSARRKYRVLKRR